jgi:molybdate transport system ATP-binding protein
VGFLFQEYALFPHLTVRENIGYGLSRLRREVRQTRVGEILTAFGLQGLEDRLPRQISGGQQQRVALARALVVRPKLLLLDEPLSALDQNTREEIRRELRRMLSGYGIPVVIVTHDRTEAIALADQVLVLDRGGIRQSGSVAEVFSKPASLDVARIVGIETVVPGEVVGVSEGLARARVGNVELTAVAPPELNGQPWPAKVHVCFRAEDVLLVNAPAPTSARNHFPATILSLTPEGPLVRVLLQASFELTALVTRPAAEELGLAPGNPVTVLIKAQAVHLLVR